jgi:hypothetical protein
VFVYAQQQQRRQQNSCAAICGDRPALIESESSR